MSAANLKTYPVFQIRGRNYVDMTDNGNPVLVWTPSGLREAPNIVGAEDTPPNRTMPHDLNDIRQTLSPGAGRLASGDFYRVLFRLEKTNPEVARSMVTGSYKATGTLADFSHCKKVYKNGTAYFDGLLVQHPETDGERLLTDDRGIIRARDVWEMPLPLEGGYVKELLRETPVLGKFFDAIYGMENAGHHLPDYAHLNWPNNPTDVLNLLRGRWPWRPPMDWRVFVDGLWRPSDSDWDVASRAAVRGRIIQPHEGTIQIEEIELL
ncbi:hypothetical protein H0O02_03330 [Candidatus Micrarchaeota archaeon]|nr:hypothetical protein [Candidatus Micrarchaeota archaeon]